MGAEHKMQSMLSHSPMETVPPAGARAARRLPQFILTDWEFGLSHCSQLNSREFISPVVKNWYQASKSNHAVAIYLFIGKT